MKSILIDAGPIIALFRKNDKYHKRAIDFLRDYEGRLLTSWPVIAEVMYELNKPDVQEKFLTWIERGGLEIVDMGQEVVSGLIKLIHQYADVPMDLADATLMLYAEKTGINEIATIDSDFYIYRTPKNDYLKNIFI
jgi:predicted nucleic acid-binding protein